MRSATWRGISLTVLATAGPGLAQGVVSRGDFAQSQNRGDFVETVFSHGIQLELGDLVMVAERGVLVLDRDLARDTGSPSQSDVLPHRDVSPPDPRRQLDSGVLRGRLQAFLRATGRQPTELRQDLPFSIELFDSVYLEGGVVILRGGAEVARADRVLLSPRDDRLVLHDAELRMWSAGRHGPRLIVLRGAELVRQGRRTTGRKVSVTTCDAGVPHVEVLTGEVEIIERGDELEVRSRDNELVIPGVVSLPLPDARFFTGEQTEIPIRGVGLGYSSREGARAHVDLGGSLNSVGGPLHEYLTGRPAHEFRGDWELGLGYNQSRGLPLDGRLTYGAPDVYRGHMRGFSLHDQGENIREILDNLDGSPIDQVDRGLFQTENRLYLGPGTTLDVTAFRASDPAVWPEFFPGEYRLDERPETSVHLRHASANRLLTATVRSNSDSFSYASDRSLAPRFEEELPELTFDWFSEPIVTLPTGSPLLLTTSTGAGYLRNRADPHSGLPDQETLRLDQDVELALPFHWGPIGFRPFSSARITHYDKTATNPADHTRWAFTAGARAATWLGRSWSWLGDGGNRQALRHVMSPAIVVLDRFRVDGDPADYFQFDSVDQLDEHSEVRFELLNRLQHRENHDPIEQLAWLDLAQTLLPNVDRDNAGHVLGLLEYELIVTPRTTWTTIPNLRFLLEGEHDWNARRLRTFNTGLEFGRVLGLDWHAGYRTDAVSNATIDYGAATDLLGRWHLDGGSQFDLGRHKTLNYAVRMLRRDHDWNIAVGVRFDTITSDTQAYIEFEPTFGGLFERHRPNRYLSGPYGSIWPE